MKWVKYVLPMLLVQPCMAAEAMVAKAFVTLVQKDGAFDVCDINALSDGGTTSICVVADGGRFWFTKRSDGVSEWITAYENDRHEHRTAAVPAPEIDALLFSWVNYRYACSAIREMQSHQFRPSTTEGLIAATIMELVRPTSRCSG